MMKRLPKIGERVRYTSKASWRRDRTTTGTVTKVYPCDVPFGAHNGPALWHAAVQVDEPKPDWWPYGSDNMIAPSIAELEPME